MLIAIAVVLVGIFFVATGRGGELAYEQADHAPLDLGPVSAADIALLRPPSAMWGYNMQVTDAALDQIARAMRERDVTIAYLQDQLANAQRSGAFAEPRGVHARPLPVSPEESYAPEESCAPEELADPEPLEPLEASESRTGEPSAAGYEAPRDSEAPRDYEAPHDSEAPHEYEAPAAAPAEAASAEALPAETDPAETRPVAAAPTFTPTATHRQTPLVLKASGPKPPPAPEPNEVTQPSMTGETAEEPEAHAPTEPNPALSPQGSFDTHDWWAEQTEAAQKDRARRQAAGETDLDTEEEAEESGRPDGDPLAAEEQGW